MNFKRGVCSCATKACLTGGDTTCNFVQMRLQSYPGKLVSRQAQNLLFDVYFKYGFNILITVQILNVFDRFLLGQVTFLRFNIRILFELFILAQ